MPNYQQGYEDGRNDQFHTTQTINSVVQGIGSLLSIGLVLGIQLTVQLLLAAPFVMLGFVVMAPMNFLGPVLGTTRLVGMGFVAFLGYVGLYWLKGVVVALHARQGWLWLLPYSVCVGVACLLPGYLAHLGVTYFLPAVNSVWSWGIGVAFSLLAYNHYRFTENSAPVLVSWAFRRGYQWGHAQRSIN